MRKDTQPALIDLIALTVTFAMVGAPTHGFSEEPTTLLENSSSPATEGSSLIPPASPVEIEAAIRELSGPNDQERLSKIVFELGGLDDPSEQQRLQKLLNERMQALMELSIPSGEATGSGNLSPSQFGRGSEAYHEELIMMRFETLNLGPDATADDLRARDQLISEIAGIRDPVMQRELLTKLEEREREQKGVTEKP